MKRVFWIAGILLAFAVVLSAIWYLSQGPLTGQPTTASRVPLVSITDPDDGNTYPATAELTVRVQVIAAEPVQMIELWADGKLIGSAPGAPSEPLYAAQKFKWQVPASGIHALVARALDSKGHVAYSNIVRAASSTPKGSRGLVTTKAGDTFQSIARQYRVTPGEVSIVGSNGPNSNSALAPGTRVFVNLPPPALPPQEPEAPIPPPVADADEPSPDPTANLTMWFDQNVTARFYSPQTPAAPALAYSVQGCQVQLYISDTADNEQGFRVYKSQIGQTTFQPIATLGAHGGARPIRYVDPAQVGMAQYYVSAFNRGGESVSNLVQVAPDAKTCAAAAGDPGQVINAALDQLVPFDAKTVEALYFYYRVGSGDWRRAPADQDRFIHPQREKLRLGDWISFQPSGASSSIQAQVWGWKGGQLAMLGSFEREIPPGPLGSLPVRMPDQTTLKVCTVEMDHVCAWSKLWGMPGWVTKKFLWSTNYDMGGGLWQVSTQPYGSEVSLNPPGLALTGMVTNTWQFNVDFGLLAPPSPPSNPSGDPSSVQFKASPKLPNVGGTQSGKTSYSTPFDLALVLAGGQSKSGSSKNVQIYPGGIDLLDLPLASYYVRVIPMKAGQVSGAPSNTVIINIVKPKDLGSFIPSMPPEFQTTLYKVEVLDYAPAVFEDPNLWGCLTVTGYTQGVDGFAMAAWPLGDRCPEPWKGDSNQGWGGLWNDLTAGAKAFFKWASETWSDMKALAVEIIMKYTGYGAQCKLAENLVLPKGTCEKMAAVAVDAGLAAMGIPPSIPNFDKLMDEGLDYATDLAVQEALEELPACAGTPCEDELRAKVKSILKEAADAALANNGSMQGCAGEQENHAHGVEPLCPPKGVIARPQKGAIYQPPTINLKVTRLQNVPDPVNVPSCTLIANLKMNYHFPGGTVYGPYVDSPTMDAKPQDVAASPFMSVSLRIPKLKPGESRQVPLSLGAWNVPYVFPWHLTYSALFHTVLPEDFKIMDWYTVAQKGQPTINVVTNFDNPPGYVGGMLAPCAANTAYQPK